MNWSRRQFIKSTSIRGLASFLMIKPEESLEFEYLKNSELEVVNIGFKGNPYRDGAFYNLELQTNLAPFSTIMKWMMSKNPQREEKKNDTYRVVTRPLGDFRKIEKDGFIWLGHSAFLFRVEGNWLLTDPCLTAPPLQKRFSELPLSISELDKVDYLLLSHNHFDHLDSDTLGAWTNSEMKALMPLKLGETVRGMNKYLKIQEAGWYQKFSIQENFNIYLLPAHHWSRRGAFDTNESLWGSFLIETPKYKMYFCGDSNYSDHFKEIGNLFGPIDYCFMPIGAYKPSHIMKANHTTPEEAVQAFHDLKGKVFIPMHYGTFDLADEPMGEPIRWLTRLSDENKIRGELKAPDVGEVVTF